MFCFQIQVDPICSKITSVLQTKLHRLVMMTYKLDLLCLCDVFRALINSLAYWFCCLCDVLRALMNSLVYWFCHFWNCMCTGATVWLMSSQGMKLWWWCGTYCPLTSGWHCDIRDSMKLAYASVVYALKTDRQITSWCGSMKVVRPRTRISEQEAALHCAFQLCWTPLVDILPKKTTMTSHHYTGTVLAGKRCHGCPEAATKWGNQSSVCFTPTETLGTIRDGEPRSSLLLYIHRDLRDY